MVFEGISFSSSLQRKLEWPRGMVKLLGPLPGKCLRNQASKHIARGDATYAPICFAQGGEGAWKLLPNLNRLAILKPNLFFSFPPATKCRSYLAPTTTPSTSQDDIKQKLKAALPGKKVITTLMSACRTAVNELIAARKKAQAAKEKQKEKELKEAADKKKAASAAVQGGVAGAETWAGL